MTSYRVVEREYLNRVEYEEGPGSASDVVSDVTKRTIWSGELDASSPESEVVALLSELLSDQMEGDDPGGWIEYSYWVQRRVDGGWKFVGTLTRVPEPDEPYGYDPEYEVTHCPDCGGDAETHARRACQKCGDCLCDGWCDFTEGEPAPTDSCFYCCRPDCPGGCYEEKYTNRVVWNMSPLRFFWRAYYGFRSALNRQAA